MMSVWFAGFAAATVANFLYRGLRYGDDLTGASTYAIARAESRDQGQVEPISDGVRCRNCGAPNEPAVRFCRCCLSSLPG